MLGDRYRLERLLGRGGMGAVYEARDVILGRRVAIKVVVVADDGDDDVMKRFEHEARHTARLQHPNIIDVYDLGATDVGELYFVMEILDGESLADRLRREGRLPPAVAVDIARQLLEGVGFAHAHGIVHRDLKPANVMLVPADGGTERVKVLDFGVAKSQTAQTKLTRAGFLVGTLEYMSPEQLSMKPVDGRSDLYAIGLVLYRMLSGTNTFPDAKPVQAIEYHLKVVPDSLLTRAPGVGITPALDRVVLRALSKRPEDRWQTAAEFSEGLIDGLRGIVRDGKPPPMLLQEEPTNVVGRRPSLADSVETGYPSTQRDGRNDPVRDERDTARPPARPPAPMNGRSADLRDTAPHSAPNSDPTVPRFPSQTAGRVSALPPAQSVVNDFDDELATEVLDPARHRAHLRVPEVAASVREAGDGAEFSANASDLRATKPVVLSGAHPIAAPAPMAASGAPTGTAPTGSGPSSRTLVLIAVAGVALALGAWGALSGNGIAAIFGGIVALGATAAHLIPRKAP